MDIAIQEYGCAAGLILLIQDNADRLVSVEAMPIPGMLMRIRKEVPTLTDENVAIVAEYKKRKIEVACGGQTVTTPLMILPPYVLHGYVLGGGYAIPSILTINRINLIMRINLENLIQMQGG